MKRIFKAHKYRNLFIVFLFIISLAIGVFYQINKNSIEQTSFIKNQDSQNNDEFFGVVKSNSSYPTPPSQNQPPMDNKFASAHINLAPSTSVVEVQNITADKTAAETGETVNYTVTIKNEGTKKKFLTHICFNHSGGVTFGCVMNKNLYPQEEFNLNNSNLFTKPGTYSVWITVSQDGTNFYRPLNSSSAVVNVSL